jgi:hypothetical protein
VDRYKMMGRIEGLESLLIPLADSQPELIFEMIRALRENHLTAVFSEIEKKSEQPTLQKAGFLTALNEIEKICVKKLFKP